MKPEMVAKLSRKGIPVDTEGKFVSKGLLDKTARVPICVVFGDSKDLSEEEIKIIKIFIDKNLKKFRPEYVSKNGRLVQGANTITFWKCANGYWKIHRLSWGHNKWFNFSGSLEMNILKNARLNSR